MYAEAGEVSEAFTDARARAALRRAAACDSLRARLLTRLRSWAFARFLAPAVLPLCVLVDVVVLVLPVLLVLVLLEEDDDDDDDDDEEDEEDDDDDDDVELVLLLRRFRRPRFVRRVRPRDFSFDALRAASRVAEGRRRGDGDAS